MEAWKNAPQRGVVGRAASASVFDLERWQPSERCAEFVEHFWAVRWDLRDQQPFESTVITFPCMHLTHEWGTDVIRHGHPLPNTLIHGVVERVFHTTLSQSGAVVGARFRPGGFTARFGRAAADHTGLVTPVDNELFGAPIGLVDDVQQAAATIDHAISAHSVLPDATYGRLTGLLERIRDDNDLHRVGQVMEHSPWSARTTQRVFRHYVGVPVKWVLCRYRLQRAALDIETEPVADLAELAVRHGWYDQAHFANDFRSMLGCTPGEYATRHGA